jgi:translation initiation factor IF-1
VRCDDGHVVTASLAGRTKQVTVAVKPGDRVTVTLSQFDPTRAKITERHR